MDPVASYSAESSLDLLFVELYSRSSELPVKSSEGNRYFSIDMDGSSLKFSFFCGEISV